MKNRILTVGRSGCGWADEAVGDYGKRMRRYGGVEERFVKAETFRGDVERVRRLEGERILKQISPRERLVALDERGLALNTHEFTALVDKARQGGTNLVWAIGGPYGLCPEVREKAWRVVRLSSLVLNHEVARVALYEQLYRSMTLLHNVPYHH